MSRVIVVIPNRIKCAPNDIAISQALALQEMGHIVNVLYLRKKGNDYNIETLDIFKLISKNGFSSFFKSNEFILHMFLPSLLAFFCKNSLCYVHSDIGPDCEDQYGPFKGYIVKTIWKIALLRSKKVAVVSDYLKFKSQLSKDLPEQKIIVVPTTTQHPCVYNIDNQSKSLRITHSIGSFRLKHKKVFVVVGSFRKLKNQKRIIDLILTAKNKNTSIGVIFFGDGEMLYDVVNKAITLGVSSNCLFLGHVEYPHMYIDEGDTLLSTSLSEGFPLSFIEARDNKIPVLALNIENFLNAPDFVKLFNDEKEFISQITKDKINVQFNPSQNLKDICKILVSNINY